MTSFQPGDRVYIDNDRTMLGTVDHIELQQKLSGQMETFVHVQFDHTLQGAEPGFLLPCQPRLLTHDHPVDLTPAEVERWLAS